MNLITNIQLIFRLTSSQCLKSCQFCKQSMTQLHQLDTTFGNTETHSVVESEMSPTRQVIPGPSFIYVSKQQMRCHKDSTHGLKRPVHQEFNNFPAAFLEQDDWPKAKVIPQKLAFRLRIHPCVTRTIIFSNEINLLVTVDVSLPFR